jgi:UDP-N-acetylglucosamine 4-epimerase
MEANLLAAEASSPTGLTCNVACGARYTLTELLSAIGDAAGRPVEPRFGPPRAGDIVHSQADITLARDALGYEPVVSFHEGITRTVAWYRERMTGQAAHPERSPGQGT